MVTGDGEWRKPVDHFASGATRHYNDCARKVNAILTSSALVLADDPTLTVRWSELDEQTQGLYPQQNLRQPVRIVIDSQNRVTPGTSHCAAARRNLVRAYAGDSREWPETVRTLLIPEHKGHLDLVVLMMQLGKQQINSIWVEAGPTLAGALLQAGLVDELIVYIAPKLLGNDARGLCTLPGGLRN